MKLLAVVLLVTLAVAAQAQTPNGNIADVSNFKALRSWGDSTLYQIEATTNYAVNPYLIHLVGTRYGEKISLKIVMVGYIYYIYIFMIVKLTNLSIKTTKCIFSRYRFANTNGYCAGTSRLPRAFNFRARV